ncbi:MAG: sigma-70 family RNA polymerase sigma factor [Armatimonadetes bacterium]|nr:sigma-70 family RNA polymerase sigma factor [Armatimonadota bacterium]
MTTHADDSLLIEHSQEGDRQAFDALIRKYEQRAYQYAHRLTSNPEEASDIVAEAFVRVFNALKNFKGQSSFSTWLYRILTNCYLDHRKKERNRQHQSLEASLRLDGGEVQMQVEDQSPRADEIAEQNEREQAVQAALGHMPEYQQVMLVMYHVEALSYEDISDALDLPIGTVKSRLNRARLALRDRLAQDVELFNLS